MKENITVVFEDKIIKCLQIVIKYGCIIFETPYHRLCNKNEREGKGKVTLQNFE